MIYDTIWYINIKTIQYEPVLIKYIATDTVKYSQALKKEKSNRSSFSCFCVNLNI